MGYFLGVDLGTTYTAAAICRDGRVEIASLGDRSLAIPSVLFVRPDGEVVTGDSAVRRLMTEPDRVAREFKRRLGDQTPIFLGGSPYSADALMGRLLKWTVDTVSRQENAAPDGVVISYPANWGPYKRELLQQSIERAGLEQTETITEPKAAAIHYASLERVDQGMTIAVYDLGGGTFDAAVLRKTDSGFDVLGDPVGIERLGGIDFDAAVFEHVRRSLGGAVSELDPDDERVIAAMSRLRQDCIDAKEALSNDTDVSVPVMLPNVQTEVRLTRGEFEDMIRPQIAETVEALERAITGAGLAPGDVNRILLVGGSSRIPLISDTISQELGRPIAVDTHPKHAVALGAALLAHRAGAGVAASGAEPAIGPGAEAVTSGPLAPSTPGEPLPKTRSINRNLAAAIAVAIIAAVAVLATWPGDSTDDTVAATPDDVVDQPTVSDDLDDAASVTVDADDSEAPDDGVSTTEADPSDSDASDSVVTDGPALIVELPRPDATPIEPIEVTDPINLSPFARVTASAEIDGPVELLTDGINDDNNSPWVAGVAPAWVEFDLRTPSTITEVRVTPFQGGTNVELSSRHELSVRATESEPWQVVQTLTPSWIHRVEQTISLDTPLQGVRYVRLDSLQTPSSPGWFEIEVHGIPSDTTILSPPRWVNVAPYAGISASSAVDGARPGLAADGIAEKSSRWMAEPGSPAWIQFDLPEPITLADITMLSGDDDNGRLRFTVEVSQDGGELVTVSDRTTWLRNEQEFRLTPLTAYPQVTSVRITSLPSGYADDLTLGARWWEVQLWAS